jgi:hypothetical protein
MAETFPEEVWMVEQLRGTVAKVARISMQAHTLVVELLCARLRRVARLLFAFDHDETTPVPLTMEERAASMVVRS